MSDTVEIERNPLTKKELVADKPTWCPGCGDFSVLALYFKLIQNRGLHHEKFATVAGIGCSSRFPYFVQAHGAHYIHGRARITNPTTSQPPTAKPSTLRQAPTSKVANIP